MRFSAMLILALDQASAELAEAESRQTHRGVLVLQLFDSTVDSVKLAPFSRL